MRQFTVSHVLVVVNSAVHRGQGWLHSIWSFQFWYDQSEPNLTIQQPITAKSIGPKLKTLELKRPHAKSLRVDTLSFKLPLNVESWCDLSLPSLTVILPRCYSYSILFNLSLSRFLSSSQVMATPVCLFCHSQKNSQFQDDIVLTVILLFVLSDVCVFLLLRTCLQWTSRF